MDLLTVVGQKMYAPKGIAALYVRDGVQLEPVDYGGGQEHGLRSGIENVALAVALGAAAQVATDELASAAALSSRTRATFSTSECATPSWAGSTSTAPSAPGYPTP